MFKKVTFLLIFQLFLIPAKAQDYSNDIEVSVNDPNPKVQEYDFCRLSIKATKYDPSSVTIEIGVENINETYSIFLFGHAYTEKALKRENICFDKKSYGTTSKEIKVCEGLDGDKTLSIAPNGNRMLTFGNVSESIKKVELPIYIAKLKEKKLFSKEKYMIRERVKLILTITLKAEEKNDTEYEDIKRKYDELVANIEAHPVCTAKGHPESEEVQIKRFKDEIDNLKDNIADIKSKNRWKERDEDYKPYKELLHNLDKIEIKKEVCGKCRRSNRRSNVNVTGSTRGTTHSCKYCSTSPSDILRTLQRTYQELDNRKISKTAAKKKIEGLHRAWTGGCSELKHKMATDKNTGYKVKRYYEAIVNY